MGVIGMWSCWLEDQLFLGYPYNLGLGLDLDSILMDRLNVEYSNEVMHVNCIAVAENYNGDLKDPDKPIELNKYSQHIAYKSDGMRKWAKFYGPRLNGSPGRVWIDHSECHSYTRSFELIHNEELIHVYFGDNRSMSIYTYPYPMANKYALDSPTTESARIQQYRDGFIDIMCYLSDKMGGATAITINYGLVFSPDQLDESSDYGEATWKKGAKGINAHFGGSEVFYKKEGEELTLLSGNSLVPWSTIRKIYISDQLTVETVLSYLTF